MNQKKIVVVEFGSWHDECLYTPCLMFTKLGYQVILAANSKLKGRVGSQLAELTPSSLFVSGKWSLDYQLSLFKEIV